MKGIPAKITDEIREQVRLCAGFGLTWAQISSITGISERTLHRYCSEEFDSGVAYTTGNVARTLYQTATDRTDKAHVTAAIFYLKTRARWRENHETENNKPLPAIKIEIEQKPS